MLSAVHFLPQPRVWFGGNSLSKIRMRQILQIFLMIAITYSVKSVLDYSSE
jgi:hypothetical protein